MPIENEFKMVLADPAGALHRSLRSRPEVRMLRVEQAYLTKGTRVRQTEDLASGEIKREFTFKRRVGGHVVEIETAISEDDFMRLWSTREDSLEKIRFAYVEDDIHWDVDYFGRLKDPYFIMAEAEMPESRRLDKTVPEPSRLIEDFVIHVVGQDHGFSSRRLCSRKYAAKMLADLVGERRPERVMAFG